jgi:hypothetical protein
MSAIQSVQGRSQADIAAAAGVSAQAPHAPNPAPAAKAQAPAADTVQISSAGKAASEAAATPAAAPAANPGTAASAAKTPPQPQTAAQIAQDSPAQLAQLAAAGNTTAKRILAQRAAAKNLGHAAKHSQAAAAPANETPVIK